MGEVVRPAGEPLVEVSGLRVTFPGRSRADAAARSGQVNAVDGVSLTIHRGETLGIVGESGSGKSTLGKVMLGLQPPSAGEVRYDGDSVGDLRRGRLLAFRRRAQMIFQDPYSSLDPRMTVNSLIEEPLVIHRIARGAERSRRVDAVLDLVSLSSRYKHRYPHQFSGGQRQRIGIAQALVLEPEFVVCDEPTSALDVSVQAQILNLLMELKSQLKLTMAYISHDLATVRMISDRVAVMYRGQVVEEAPTDQLFSEPRHEYTQALLRASTRPGLLRS
jgi:ABC-type glutathione transport system ATPase component